MHTPTHPTPAATAPGTLTALARLEAYAIECEVAAVLAHHPDAREGYTAAAAEARRALAVMERYYGSPASEVSP